jgi:HEAT repeat protein
MDRCQEIVERLQAEDIEALREAAFAAGDGSCYQAIPHLTSLLSSEHVGVQEAAETSLRRLGGPRTVQSIIPLLWSESPPVRNVALDILRDICDQDLERVTDLLVDDDADIRIFAADILGHSGSMLAVNPLCSSLLKDPEANVRSQAAVSLGLLAHPEAGTCLKQALHDEEWVQFAVIEALKKIRDESSIVALNNALGRGSELVDSMVIEALGEMASLKSVPVLLNTLSRAAVPLRNKVIQALIRILGSRMRGLLQTQERQTFLSYLAQALEDDDPEIQDAAVQGLEYLGGEEASRAILDFLHGLDEELDSERLSAARQSLRAIGLSRALTEAVRSEDEATAARAILVLTEIDDPQARQLLMERFWTVNRDTQREISQALRNQGGPEARSFFLRLLKEHGDGTVLKNALLFLGKKCRMTDTADQLMAFLDHRFPDVRQTALEACIALGTQEVLDHFMDMVASPEPERRWLAYYGLGNMEDGGQIDTLRQGLQDDNPDVRTVALQGFAAHCRNDDSIIREIRSFLADESREVRLEVVSALQGCSHDDVKEPLLEALKDDDDWVRIRALEGLVAGGFADPSLVVGLLDSRNTLLKIKAIEALGDVGGEEAFQQLLELMQDEDADIRSAAEEALFRIR